MDQALQQLPLSTACLVENYCRLQYELGDLIKGLLVFYTRKKLVSGSSYRPNRVRVSGFLSDTVWKGEIQCALLN